MAESYTVVPHSALGTLAPRLYDLTRLAFSSYPGVLVPSEAHRAWYIRRPGMDGELSRAALTSSKEVVASVFVTVAGVRLAGEMRPVGIVDTVMTHPEHRQRGLARQLLEESIALMRARGLTASLLYTMPASGPFHFYRSLGYRPHAPVRYLRRRQPQGRSRSGNVQAACAGDAERLMTYLNGHFASHDGYIVLEDPLWRWRKQTRPAELPAQVLCLTEQGRLASCVTLCAAPIVGAQATSWVLTDCALEAGPTKAHHLEALLSTIPAGDEAVALCAENDVDYLETLTACGFASSGAEVAMILPLAPAEETWLIDNPRPWYVLAESVVGV